MIGLIWSFVESVENVFHDVGGKLLSRIQSMYVDSSACVRV